MVANKQAELGTTVVSVLISYVCSILGGAVGSALGKLLQWVQKNYFAEGNVRNDHANADSGFTNAPLPAHVDLRDASARTHGEIAHYCGQEHNGFMRIILGYLFPFSFCGFPLFLVKGILLSSFFLLPLHCLLFFPLIIKISVYV
jgi:hypothetical protein